MTQKLTILFDLDGTLVDTAPDLMTAHNHVMKNFGYNTKSISEIRNYIGKGAAVMIGRSLWGEAKKELSKITDQKVKDEMLKEIDALLDLVDQANERAVELVKAYHQEKRHELKGS